MVERAEPATERTEPERAIALVLELKAALAIFVPETTPLSTQMPISATATATQDILASLTISHTLLLLTSGPQFDRTATPAYFTLPSH